MAKMKIEVLAARAAKYGVTLRDRLIGYLPRYAPYAAKLGWLLNLRDRVPGLAKLSEPIIGFSARRKLPRWRMDIFEIKEDIVGPVGGPEVVLFADTFNRYYERENLDAALDVLTGAGYRVHLPKLANGSTRPLCCGRTFLTAGLVAEAKAEAARTMTVLLPFARRGIPIVGLEPSCIFTFRDEMPSMAPGEDAKLLAKSTFLFEEFLAKEIEAGWFDPPLAPIGANALLHGHCHQKAFDVMGPVQKVLARVPGLQVDLIESSCCGMAGAFGYQKETIDVSLKMAELSLLPAVRKANNETILVADGTSCRHQIKDGSGRAAIHVALLLAKSMAAAKTRP
jgi:Fe-S oxidoreductase